MSVRSARIRNRGSIEPHLKRRLARFRGSGQDVSIRPHHQRATRERGAAFYTRTVTEGNVNPKELRCYARDTLPNCGRTKRRSPIGRLHVTARCGRQHEERVDVLTGQQITKGWVPEILADQDTHAEVSIPKGVDASAAREVAALIEHAIRRQIQLT